jgi:hypothetical protein
MATTSHVAGSLPSRLAATAILPSVLARCRTAPPHAYQVWDGEQKEGGLGGVKTAVTIAERCFLRPW